MKEFIKGIPKAELHLHIEGSLEPELMFEIAQRNEIELEYNSVEELRKAYSFDCLQDFLDIYYAGASALLHKQDFYDLTMAYLRKCREENIVHAEIMFDPQTHTDRGVSFETVIEGILSACDDAKAEWGMSTLLIMSYLRHLSEESGFEILEMAKPYADRIKAVGLDSSEVGNPPSKFSRLFEASVAQGYIPLAHAGEEGPPAYVWEAIDGLKIDRIDHGNRCLEEDTLVEEIVKRDLALTLCPLSNLELRVIDKLEDHPIKKMMQKGLKVTVNSDDPAYFGGYLNENFVQLQEAVNLDKAELIEIVKNSFKYSLLDTSAKQTFLDKVEAYTKDF